MIAYYLVVLLFTDSLPVKYYILWFFVYLGLEFRVHLHVV